MSSESPADPLLLLDLGNSRCKWRLRCDTRPHSGEFATGQLSVAQLISAWRGLQRPPKVVAASVIGAQAEQQVDQACERLWQTEVRFLRTSQQAAGVRCGYQLPASLGVDRWAALIAARQLCPSGALIADFGTAATIDLLDGQGQHWPGLILPGMQRLQQCLLAGTRIGIDKTPGEDTLEGMRQGALQALCGALERMHAQWSRRLDQALPILLTGGDSATLASELNLPFRLCPELVLDGVEYLAIHPEPQDP